MNKNYRNCQHSKVHSVQFLAKNILLEEETDIKALQLDLAIVLSVMKLMRDWRDDNEDGLTHSTLWYCKSMKPPGDQVWIEFQGILVSPVYAPLQSEGCQQNLRGMSAPKWLQSCYSYCK